MFDVFDKALLTMACLRLLSGSIEIIAALLMLKFNQIEKAFLINSSLALVGPIILIATTTVGLIGIADRVSFAKICWILAGVGCIVIGIRVR